MTIYVEAYYGDGTQILGNLDGQFAFIGVKDYKRTIFYKNLKLGKFRALPSVAYWKIVDERGKVFEVIDNPNFKEGGK